MNLDPSFEAWRFWKWNDTFTILNMDLLDYFFYPLCGILQVYIIKIIEKTSIDYECSLALHITINSIITTFTIIGLILFPVGGCGWTLVLIFMLTGNIAMWIRRFNIFTLVRSSNFLILFACVWDIAAVTTIPAIFGNEVAQWYYLDNNNNHSSLFLSYENHSWAWIGRSPLEITPLFSIVGAIFVFGTYNLLFRKEKRLLWQ